MYAPAFPFLHSSMDRRAGHCRRYTKSILTARINRAGLQVVDCHYADSLGVLATLVYKACGSRNGDISIRALRAYDTFVFPFSRFADRRVERFAGKNVFALAIRAD